MFLFIISRFSGEVRMPEAPGCGGELFPPFYKGGAKTSHSTFVERERNNSKFPAPAARKFYLRVVVPVEFAGTAPFKKGAPKTFM
ncbi:hypothetical protein LJC45_00650 [Alistipes sp. OttesenSCG-928-B03]|nr:hypothetical protein [Alistipes sp. OttesenSCG-928-B03]